MSRTLHHIFQFFFRHPKDWKAYQAERAGGPLESYHDWRMSLIRPWSGLGTACIAVHIIQATDTKGTRLNGWIRNPY